MLYLYYLENEIAPQTNDPSLAPGTRRWLPGRAPTPYTGEACQSRVASQVKREDEVELRHPRILARPLKTASER